MELVTVRSSDIAVAIDALRGGRVAQVSAFGTPLLVGFSERHDAPTAWGAYPMVPWAGRIRHGRFTFRGEVYELPANMGLHAIHGVGFTSAWSVEAADDTTVELLLRLPDDERWPFGGTVRQSIRVSGTTAVFAMTVTAADQAFPVSFGWHPWFRKPATLEFRPTAMYRRDDEHMAIDELIDVPAGPWDDCFVNHRPVRFRIEEVDVELISDCTHWVVYDEPDHATCIEPQTGPPDAFNIAPHVLEPGRSLTASYELRVSVGAVDTVT